MKYILIILAILGLLVYAWILGAGPSDEEVERGQMMKIDKELRRYK